MKILPTRHEGCHLPTLCCILKEEGHRGIGCEYSWFFPCTQGISTNEASDVAIESSDDGISEYGRDEDYTPLVSVPPALDETNEPAESKNQHLLQLFLTCLSLLHSCLLLPMTLRSLKS